MCIARVGLKRTTKTEAGTHAPGEQEPVQGLLAHAQPFSHGTGQSLSSECGNSICWPLRCALLCCAVPCHAVTCCAVYEAGSKNAIKTTTIVAPNTRYSDNIYYPNKSYEVYIYARCVFVS